MDGSVYWFVKQNVAFFRKRTGKTLDVGSLDVNGNVRDLFKDYIGVDMREGDNVDVVANGHALPFDDNTFDCVRCLEMIEHDDDPAASLAEMHRVLKPAGLPLLTTRGIGFGKHEYPSDYWRFTAEGLKVLMASFDHCLAEEDVRNQGVYGWAVK